MTVVRVTAPVVASSMDFRFAGPYTGLERFETAGTTIGWSNDEAVRMPYDDCMLVMPSLRQLRPGAWCASAASNGISIMRRACRNISNDRPAPAQAIMKNRRAAKPPRADVDPA